jgi:Tfp pilus assembly protein PilO
MDLQSIFNVLLGVLLTGLGWFANQLWDAVKELKTDLAKLREELPKQYVAKDDYKSDLKEIKEMLGKIFDQLNDKADKP